MQTAVIEFARDVLGLKEADSGEFNEGCSEKVIDFMPDQRGEVPKGGTMRLGAYPCIIKKGSALQRAYGTLEIQGNGIATGMSSTADTQTCSKRRVCI